MLAFLGGTGPEGRGLALRLAMAGEQTIIGSRDAARAAAAADELLKITPGARIQGAANADAAAMAEVVFLTFPYEGQRPTLERMRGELDGKVVVNVIAPMQFQRGQSNTPLNCNFVFFCSFIVHNILLKDLRSSLFIVKKNLLSQPLPCGTNAITLIFLTPNCSTVFTT